MRQLRVVSVVLYIVAAIALLGGLVALFVTRQYVAGGIGIGAGLGALLTGLAVSGVASIAGRIIGLLTVIARGNRPPKQG